jgi:hypothetical protein
MNRVTVKGKTYAYPRYQFCNRSDDIRRISVRRAMRSVSSGGG